MVRHNLMFIAALTALLWAISITTLLTTGFVWWWFYLAVGSLFGLWMFAADPEILMGEHGTRDSLMNYVLYLVFWVFVMAYTAGMYLRFAWISHGSEGAP